MTTVDKRFHVLTSVLSKRKEIQDELRDTSIVLFITLWDMDQEQDNIIYFH
jgi:hypothetical protein